MRKVNYLSIPLECRSMQWINGTDLNEFMENLYENSKKVRKSDILNVIRFSDFSKGYNYQTKNLPLFKNDKLNTETEDNLDKKIQVLIEIIEDDEAKASVKLFYLKHTKKDRSFKEKILDQLLSMDYSFLLENWIVFYLKI